MDSTAELAAGCIEAKSALETFGGVELTFAIMPSTSESMATTTGELWADATPEKQAAIIECLHADANGEC